ncbi:MAG: zinc-ribbon domain-containing protein, partial [Kangiellaceae bacterium]|nr:zinc-ribbon domain-containing protein [Kangiellaceae bacterium]
MEEYVQYTRCPQCQTAFKVTEKLLGMAKGKVRCGACLAVFQATEHLVKPSASQVASQQSQPPGPAQPSDSTQSEEVQEASTQEAQPRIDEEKKNYRESRTSTIDEGAEPKSDIPLHIGQSPDSANDFEPEVPFESDFEEDPQLSLDDEEMDIDAALDGMEMAVDDDAELDNLSEQSELVVNREPSDLSVEPSANNDDEILDEPLDSDNEVADIDSELDFADAALDSLGDPSFDESPIQEHGFEEDNFQGDDFELNDSHLVKDPTEKVDEDLFTETFEVAEEPNLEQETLSADQSLSEENLVHSDFDGIEQNEPKLDESALTDPDLDALLPDESEFHEFESDPEEFELVDEQDSLSSDPQIQEDELDMDVDLLADNLTSQIEDADTEPDPLDEFEERVEKKKTGLRNGIIAASSIILIGALFYQFWQNRQELSWDPTWGGLTKSVCNLLPCDLKPRRDVSKLRLRQRIVSPSETKENVLQVKILLVNQAEFAQPYPTIQIKFSNTEGRQMAVKQFLPAEYFPEKAAELIPSDTEVHIS